ncbi:lysozyme [Methylobacterium sp. J-043]|nr:lysozyme [Methylobacterium sp. J-043]
MRITQAEADDILARDLVRFEDAVARLVRVPVTQNQFDALVSFAFNLGEGNLGSSTLLKKLNAGDYDGAADQFARWNKAKGKVLTGLTRRRAAEADLFRRPVAGASTNPATSVAPTTSRAPTGLLAALLGLFRKA